MKTSTIRGKKGKKVKGWAVIWPGADRFITSAHISNWDTKAIFATYKMAKRFAREYVSQKNTMKVVRCEIIYTLPKKK